MQHISCKNVAYHT